MQPNKLPTFDYLLKLKYVILCSCLWITTTIKSQDTLVTPSDQLQISVVTCGPGTELYSMYGHNAIRIIDPSRGSDLVYNYGTFSFEEPGFLIKFLRGKLMYYVTVTPYNNFIYEYQMTNRSVNEQVLALSNEEKTALAKALDQNLLPENRYYKYDFFQDNCATRIRDMIYQPIIATLPPQSEIPLTYRQLIKKYQSSMPWTAFGIDLIIGAKADIAMTPSQECFIPDYLAYHLSKTNTKSANQPIVLRINALFTSVITPDQSPSWVKGLLSPYFFFFILLLFELNLYLRFKIGKPKQWFKAYDQILITIMALLFVLMSFMWWGTDHVPTKNNWNLLWVTPFLIIWWFTKGFLSPSRLYTRYACVAILVICLVNAIPGITFLPQYFHPMVGVIVLILLIKILRVMPLPWKN